MQKKLNREEALLRRLRQTGSISLGEAMQLFAISEATARRLFSALEESGEALRCYGGIRLATASEGYSFPKREQESREEKTRIGALAASLVESGDAIYLDSGTTILQMALALNERIFAGAFQNLRIFTNSIANITALTPSLQVKVILLGGEYCMERRDFSGSLTEGYLEPFHFDKCFLGADGVTLDAGFCSDLASISGLNARVMRQSGHSFALLSSEKFGRSALMSYAKIGSMQSIVADRAPEQPYVDAWHESGTRLYTADRLSAK